jgi:hypothetical protein
MRIHAVKPEQQHRRQMFDAIVLEQKHGGVPQRLAPDALRSGSGSAVTRCVARQGVQPTPDHEFRTFKQSVLS